MTAASFRLELCSKSTRHLTELLPFLESNRFGSLNLPNKAKGELPGLLDRARLLSERLPQADVCVHYSINANYDRAPDAAFAALTDFCRQLAALERCSLLLVSGGGPRKRLDTLTALERMAGSPEWRQLRLPLAVAFNPYFPDNERQQQERRRLRHKLLAGGRRVVAVYLQAGSDERRLREGLLFLQQLLAEVGRLEGDHQQQQQQADPPARAGKRRRLGEESLSGGAVAAQQQRQPGGGQPCAGSSISVYGSLLVPSRKLLAAMRFRPWGGVFLSEHYLSSVDAADGITRQLLSAYADFSVTPLVETEVASQVDADRVCQLLGGTGGPPNYTAA